MPKWRWGSNPKNDPKTTEETPNPTESGYTEPSESVVQLTGQDGLPIETQAEVSGKKDGEPIKLELSGSVAVDVNVKKPEVPAASQPGIDAGQVLADHSTENIFTSFRQQESALSETTVFKILAYDPILGRRTTIGDVRRVYGQRLDLGPKHSAFVAGEVVDDNFTPSAGQEVVWQESAKTRG